MPTLHQDDPGAAGEIVCPPLPTPEQNLLAERGRQIFLNTVPTLNEMLGRLVTLSTALAGGGFVVAKGDVVPAGIGKVALGFFLIALLSAFVGVCPKTRMMNWEMEDEIKSHTESTVHRKSYSIIVSGILIFTGLSVAFIGACFK